MLSFFSYSPPPPIKNSQPKRIQITTSGVLVRGILLQARPERLSKLFVVHAKSYPLLLSNNVKSIATGLIYSILYRAATFVLIPECATQMMGLVGSSYQVMKSMKRVKYIIFIYTKKFSRIIKIKQIQKIMKFKEFLKSFL